MCIIISQKVEDTERALDELYSSSCNGGGKPERNAQRSTLKDKMVKALNARFEDGFVVDGEEPVCFQGHFAHYTGFGTSKTL